MEKYSRCTSTCNQADQLPEWVIEQMIALCEFAERNGLPSFESRLIDATEIALEEFNTKLASSRNLRARIADIGTTAHRFH